mmetsp:Transcript_31398/g.28577  ORF Transcript_31398/g.28577 Transcript_31398/m.28577 type:complete len:82 (-) Transcript_31398:83-328(-)
MTGRSILGTDRRFGGGGLNTSRTEAGGVNQSVRTDRSAADVSVDYYRRHADDLIKLNEDIREKNAELKIENEILELHIRLD